MLQVNHVYKGEILQRNYMKMTMLWSFSYNSFVIFHGKKYGRHNMTMLYSNPLITRCVINGLYCTSISPILGKDF